MKYNDSALWAILPPVIRGRIPPDLLGQAQEIRLRLGKQGKIKTGNGEIQIDHIVTSEDLTFIVNAASRYSPWNATSIQYGYLTAPGGHRIGLCGEAAGEGLRNLTSVNIRIARDFPGIAARIPITDSILLLGPPGSGKTTLLRDLVRKISCQNVISVVDERGEIFPSGMDCGENMDVLSGQSKAKGIDMVLRSMGPNWIAVDEITNQEDCAGLLQAGWCGVKLVATAHASSLSDLNDRPVYRPLVQTRLFRTAVVLRQDKRYTIERLCP